MKPVEFAPEARLELDVAAAHYEDEYPGRGLRFYAAVERAVAMIARFPQAGPIYAPGLETRSVRRRVVRGFPFVLAYRDLAEVIRIDAVAHVRRQPGYWLPRR